MGICNDNLPAEFRLYDRLFLVATPSMAENIDEVLNPNSLVIKQGFVEKSLQNAVVEKSSI